MQMEVSGGVVVKLHLTLPGEISNIYRPAGSGLIFTIPASLLTHQDYRLGQILLTPAPFLLSCEKKAQAVTSHLQLFT
jgi:hypothetical protein